jgi:hypothetical protein
MKSAMESLKHLNWVAAGAHFAVFFAFLLITIFVLKKQYKSASVYRIGATAPPAGEEIDSLDYPTKVVRLGSINIANWILTFFAFTVFFHVLYATDFFGKGLYTKFVQDGWNPVRWGEYAISAAIMIVIIGELAGVRDIVGLWPAFFCVFALQFCGLIVEREAMKPLKDGFQVLAATGIGWTLLTAVWVPILFTIVKTIGDARRFAANVPSWVPIIVVLQFVQYSLFGFWQLKQVIPLVKQKALPSFFTMEKGYIVLSFASKLALGSFIGYGLIQRQNSPPELIV